MTRTRPEELLSENTLLEGKLEGGWTFMPNANSRQHIIFEVKCVDDAGNLIDNKKYEITQNRTLQAESVIKEETFEFNVNQPCRIVVSNISTNKESSTEIKTFNVMKIHSAYYTSYKAE